MQPSAPYPRIHERGGWKVHEWAEASSTNDLARDLPVWSIAKCRVQSAGRGRFNRPWIGAEGGLWSSFTVPLVPTGSAHIEWGHLPLVAGLALLDMLEALGIGHARLRWPNDVLIGEAKLAGILVERPSEHMAVIGIGVNISNDMAQLEGKVKDTPASLAQLLSPAPGIDDILGQLAESIKTRFIQFSEGGLPCIAADMEKAWKIEKEVIIQTDDGDFIGIFCGIDPRGNPVIREKSSRLAVIPAHLVNRLIEN